MNPQPIDAGVEMSFRIGQRVRHGEFRGQRITGTVRALSVEHDDRLMVTIALDAPIIIPAGDGHRAIEIYTQCVPAHKLAPFDERDELMAEMVAALQKVVANLEAEGDGWNQLDGLRALIQRATA